MYAGRQGLSSRISDLTFTATGREGVIGYGVGDNVIRFRDV